VDVNCGKQFAAEERALSVRWVRLTPAKGMQGRASGTAATSRPGHLAETGNSNPARQATFDGRFDQVGCE
jgi:hypothetical protein